MRETVDRDPVTGVLVWAALGKVLGVYRCLSLRGEVLGYVLLSLVAEHGDDAPELGI